MTTYFNTKLGRRHHNDGSSWDDVVLHHHSVGGHVLDIQHNSIEGPAYRFTVDLTTPELKMLSRVIQEHLRQTHEECLR